jgi:hypothetical protein
MCFFASLGAASLVAFNATAQTPAPTETPAVTPAAADSTAVKLPYGVEDVVKLSRAQVSEDVILNYIHNTGTIYNLSPSDIVYLRNQGVSDGVINTMLAQRQNVPAQAAAQSAAAAPQPQASPDARWAAAAQAPQQYAPTYVQAAPTYVEAQPTAAPASTVYVIPYAGGGYGYANSYPYYYGGYYPYYGPSVVVGFGYGWGGHYGGYYHGGYYGGYHGGRYYGGYHGGGYYGHYGHH